MSKDIKDYIITIPNFPEEGVMFRDVTSVLQDSEGLRLAIDELTKLVKEVDCDVICGTESRGFIFGMPVAYLLNKPFVLIRKKGKLPRETIEETYNLEYGTATIEMHKDAIKPGQKVVIIDDLIATGGTLRACCNLVERLGGNISRLVALIELEDLHGRDALKEYDVKTVTSYGGK